MTHHSAESVEFGAGMLTVLASTLAIGTYLIGSARLRRRGDRWPRGRDVAFCAGGLSLVAAVVLPLPGGEFTVHMAGHLLVGMVAPLLLILGRPVTLILRLLGHGTARRGLFAVLRLRLTGWLTHPVIAGMLSVGGLWVLYRTPLFAAADERPWLHALVHLHVLVTGLVFVVAVTRLEPLRARYALPLRAAVLVLTGAAHNVLAKSLYAAPPPGVTVPVGDLRAGAELMYYGGDVVGIALVTVLALQWYAAGGRQLRRDSRRAAVRAA